MGSPLSQIEDRLLHMEKKLDSIHNMMDELLKRAGSPTLLAPPSFASNPVPPPPPPPPGTFSGPSIPPILPPVGKGGPSPQSPAPQPPPAAGTAGGSLADQLQAAKLKKNLDKSGNGAEAAGASSPKMNFSAELQSKIKKRSAMTGN